MPSMCYQNPGELWGTGWREVPAARQKTGTKTPEQSWSLEERRPCELSPMSVLRDRCRGPATDNMQGWGWGGGGCRGGRTCWINIFSPLLPPDSPSKWKPWLIYNMDSSDSWVYILCLYTRINVPSLAKRSWCFYLQTNILRPCYMFPRLLECVDNVVW